MRFQMTVLAAAVALASTGTASAASLDETIKKGDLIVDVRLRQETVEVEGNDNHADAITVRTRLGYETPSIAGFKALYEIEDNHIIRDKFAPFEADYPGVADREISEVNRAQLSYSNSGVTAVVGRQRIILDNARFVGNVGWRQNEQTFDAAKLEYKTDSLKATYIYIDQVNGILPTFDADTSHHLTNIAYSGLPVGTITGYYYALEQDDEVNHPSVGARNADTKGLRLKGKQKLGESFPFMYTLEYAKQETTLLSGSEAEATYTAVEIGTAISGAKVFVGQESLGSDEGSYGFQTFLATKHAFNGWADQFLVTPGSGLVDSYIKAVGKVKGVKLLGFYHNYEADEGSADLGSEINLLAAYKIDKNYSVGVKTAMYSAGDSGNDVDKLWIWAGAKF
jgi:hypothetical protein